LEEVLPTRRTACLRTVIICGNKYNKEAWKMGYEWDMGGAFRAYVGKEREKQKQKRRN
jgi:hypothetical protein